jgi:hypothetical protein
MKKFHNNINKINDKKYKIYKFLMNMILKIKIYFKRIICIIITAIISFNRKNK